MKDKMVLKSTLDRMAKVEMHAYTCRTGNGPKNNVGQMVVRNGQDKMVPKQSP